MKSAVKQNNKQNKNNGKSMNNKFDELAKGMAQSVSRRQALKKFGVGLAGMALACFGLANKAKAAPKTCLPTSSACRNHAECCSKVCAKYRLYHTGFCQ
jgi:hypothetical protein